MTASVRWPGSFGVLGALAVLLLTCPAGAFCRTTTCNPNDPAEGCQTDELGCLATGTPLYWAEPCLTVSVQQAGSPRNQIDNEAFARAVERAFQSWTSTDCGERTFPSIQVQLIAPIACDQSEYNPHGGNANIVMIRENAWPYEGAIDTLGFSTVRFDKRTGEILDVDIEINAVSGPIDSNRDEPAPDAGTLADGAADDASDAAAPGADLQAILTHEAGHLLGLAHTRTPGATMQPAYAGGTSLRTIESDDSTGLCAVYPPERVSSGAGTCLPRGGYSAECGGTNPLIPTPKSDGSEDGCSLSRGKQVRSEAAGTLLMLALTALLVRRRKTI